MSVQECCTSGNSTIFDLNFYIRECRLLTQEKEQLVLEKDMIEKRRIAEVSMSRLKFCSDADFHYYSKTSSNFRKIIPTLEKELEERNKSILVDSEKIAKLEESGKLLTCENIELKRKLSESKMFIEKDREVFEKEKADFENERKLLIQKHSDLSKQSLKEKKRLELKCLKFSSLISDFEKLVICEREKFEKEKTVFETKSVEFSCKISELQKTLEKERNECDFERKESEKKKVQGFQEKCLKDDFERERERDF